MAKRGLDRIETALICGILAVIISMFAIAFATNARWEKAAIEHMAARYDPITGEFKWNSRPKYKTKTLEEKCKTLKKQTNLKDSYI